MDYVNDVKRNIDMLRQSKPVLELRTSPNSIRLGGPLEQYDPSSDLEIEGPLKALILQSYQEYFAISRCQFETDHNNIYRRVRDDVYAGISLFLERNLKMQSPTQSKVWKWAYRELADRHELENVCFSIYSYMKSFCHDGMRALPHNEEKTSTIIALLIAMQEKYGRK